MLYLSNTELIQKTDANYNLIGTYVHSGHKKNQHGKLNYLLRGEILKNDLVTRYKDRWAHTTSDVFSYCPMILNYLSAVQAETGFKNVLFVGHFLAGQTSWTMDRKAGRVLFPTPSYHSTDQTMVDPNIWLQFLPVARMAYGYTNFTMHTLAPPESRHRQLMHAIYKRYELDLIPCDRQYKFGRNIDIHTLPRHMYDCVVFAGVPKDSPETQFNKEDVLSAFNGHVRNDAVIIDLMYANPDPHRFMNARKENTELNGAFVTRKIWDSKFAGSAEEDQKIEYQILDNIIRRYNN